MRAASIYGPQQIRGHIRVDCFYCNGISCLASQRAVGALSLEVPKISLDGDLGNLTWWGAHSPWQGDRNRMGFKVPPNLSHLMIHSLAEKADLDLFIHDPCHYTQVSAFGVIQGCWIKVSLDAGLPVGYQEVRRLKQSCGNLKPQPSADTSPLALQNSRILIKTPAGLAEINLSNHPAKHKWCRRTLGCPLGAPLSSGAPAVLLPTWVCGHILKLCLQRDFSLF